MQRRRVPLPHVRRAAAAVGMLMGPVPGGFCTDIFGERTEERSQLWQEAVFRVWRAPGGLEEAAAAAEAASDCDSDGETT